MHLWKYSFSHTFKLNCSTLQNRRYNTYFQGTCLPSLTTLTLDVKTCAIKGNILIYVQDENVRGGISIFINRLGNKGIETYQRPKLIVCPLACKGQQKCRAGCKPIVRKIYLVHRTLTQPNLCTHLIYCTTILCASLFLLENRRTLLFFFTVAVIDECLNRIVRVTLIIIFPTRKLE